MKKESFIVGLVVVAGISIMIFVSFYMNRMKIALSNNYVYVKFENTDGLLENDEVRIRGVKCGSIKKIELKKDFVLVKIWLEKNIYVDKNAEIALQDLALIGGTKYLILIPKDGEKYNFPEDTLIGINNSLDMNKFLVLFEDFKQKFEELFPDKNSIQAILDTLENAISDVDKLIKLTKTDVHSIMINIDSIGNDIGDMVDTLSIVINDIKSEIEVYKAEDNTLKGFVTNDTLYIKIENSLDELNKVLKKLNKNKMIKGCL